jgi:predicted nucleic acid-binding protein
MSPFFLDASFAIAARLRRDQHHGDVARLWARKDRVRLTTTSFVLDEVATYLNARGKHATAAQIGDMLMTSSFVDFVHVDAELFQLGWKYFVRSSDKRFSLTDCISFVLMEQRGLRQALTLDRHFAQAGFEVLPLGS